MQKRIASDPEDIPAQRSEPCERFAHVLDDFIEVHRLSQQMARILRLSLQGDSNKEIAHTLKIDVRTLSTHWGRIYARTRTRSGQEFRAILFRHAVMFGDSWTPDSREPLAASEPRRAEVSDGEVLGTDEYF